MGKKCDSLVKMVPILTIKTDLWHHISNNLAFVYQGVTNRYHNVIVWTFKELSYWTQTDEKFLFYNENKNITSIWTPPPRINWYYCRYLNDPHQQKYAELCTHYKTWALLWNSLCMGLKRIILNYMLPWK
jgi:hypothetical protein